MAPLMTLADRLSRAVSVARALLDAGRAVDLSGLEDGVGLLCAKTLDMHPSDSRRMLPAMLELRAQIDRFTVRMTDERQLAAPGGAAGSRRALQ